MSSATRDENRLTDHDRNAITARLDEVIAGYGPYIAGWSDVPTMERIAAHAVGCCHDDLRDSEMSEIRAIVLTSLGLDGDRGPEPEEDDPLHGTWMFDEGER